MTLLIFDPFTIGEPSRTRHKRKRPYDALKRTANGISDAGSLFETLEPATICSLILDSFNRVAIEPYHMTDYPVRATRTSARVIEALLEVREAGVTQLAERLDLSKSAVHNHLVTLERVGFAVSDGGRYRLGLRFLDVGMNARDGSELCGTAMAEVDALADQTGEMAALVVPEFGHAVYAVTASSGRELPVRLGSRVPLHATAPGKAVLASASSLFIEEYVETHGLAALTRRTTTSATDLREELRTISDRGLAFDRDEAFEGLRSVAAPIQDQKETVGALAVIGPSERFSGKRLKEDLPGLVLTHANDIELALAN